MDTESSTNESANSPAKREKYWSELAADEKIERMREIIKRLENQGNRNYGELDKVRSLCKNHQHGQDGIVLQKVSSFDGSNCTGMMKDIDPTKVFF